MRRGEQPAEVEELRVRYLGRKAELTGVLRGDRELPPEQRGPMGKAANDVRVGARGASSTAARRRLAAAELDRRLRGPHRRDPARRPAAGRSATCT